MNPRSAEVEYLKRLIADFPAEVPPDDAAKALQKTAVRYQSIESEQYFQGVSASSLKELDLSQRLPDILKHRAFQIHRFLFKDILSNAGEIRKSSDPDGGTIGFGGTKHQRQRMKFKGTKPSKINEELEVAFTHLVLDPTDPIENVMRFYQHFVYIHPFYDANGRIGRVIVSTYLNLFGYYVQWGEFDGPNNSKFISKLNSCHDRMKSGYTFERYFEYLLSFFRKYVISVDELSDFE
ncbi:MAG TPA: Fic family protein [Fodinibius sp.]|nr:Fic family protein [Fodinibius sp.]